jgi:hypothetical protein
MAGCKKGFGYSAAPLDASINGRRGQQPPGASNPPQLFSYPLTTDFIISPHIVYLYSDFIKFVNQMKE